MTAKKPTVKKETQPVQEPDNVVVEKSEPKELIFPVEDISKLTFFNHAGTRFYLDPDFIKGKFILRPKP